jgi:hypothetical protein
MHLVVRIDQKKAQNWTPEQVIHRWKRLYNIPLLIERYQKGLTGEAENLKAEETIEQWRSRLSDLSWYMRSLNEHLARKANEEDQCKGRFWEGRYKSQALLDEAAVLTCMSYVDLNPIRAGIAKTPEYSDFTSIQQRIRDWQQRQVKQSQTSQQSAESPQTINSPRVPLMPLVQQRRDAHAHAIGYTLKDYLQLVDWAGRTIRNDKRGAISDRIPPILERLQLNPQTFLQHLQGNPDTLTHPNALGRVEKLKSFAHRAGRKFIKGIGQSKALYLKPVTE